MADYRGNLKDKNNNQLYIEDVYSTNEIKTNKVWMNGKPIYRKYYQFATSSSDVTSWTQFNSAPTNYDEIIDMRGILSSPSNSDVHPINFYEAGNQYIMVMLLGKTKMVYKATNYRGMKVIVILEYTKTTN